MVTLPSRDHAAIAAQLLVVLGQYRAFRSESQKAALMLRVKCLVQFCVTVIGGIGMGACGSWHQFDNAFISAAAAAAAAIRQTVSQQLVGRFITSRSRRSWSVSGQCVSSPNCAVVGVT